LPPSPEPAPRGTGKRVAISQSNYIPWKGYFDLINFVDEFIILDDVQYTTRDWRNRNRIKTPAGLLWLTIPVKHGSFSSRIEEVTVSDPTWGPRHWKTIAQNYARAPFFDSVRPVFEPLYSEASESSLSRINRTLIDAVCGTLGVTTRTSLAGDYEAAGKSTARLVELCRQSGAARYLSVPGSRAYLDESAFEEAGIELEWMDYSGYPEYPQLHGAFEHKVTILDLLFNVGADAARRYMKSFTGPAGPSS
jgi:hypothetical protein